MKTALRQTRMVRKVRASTADVELDFDFEIDWDEPQPAPSPLTAPEPATEPQSVKAAIVRWLEGRC